MELRKIKVYAVTMKKVMERLDELQNISCDSFKESVEEAFDGYDVEGEEELVGQNNWCDFSQNGKYELNIKINHPNAYEFTIHIETKNGKISVVNTL